MCELRGFLPEPNYAGSGSLGNLRQKCLFFQLSSLWYLSSQPNLTKKGFIVSPCQATPSPFPYLSDIFFCPSASILKSGSLTPLLLKFLLLNSPLRTPLGLIFSFPSLLYSADPSDFHPLWNNFYSLTGLHSSSVLCPVHPMCKSATIILKPCTPLYNLLWLPTAPWIKSTL